MINLTSENNTERTLPDDFVSITSTHREVIETVISTLAENESAMVYLDAQGYLWKFQYGSVEVYVQLTGETDDDLLTVWAAVLQLPAEDEQGLMRKLLIMNWEETLETRFGIMNDKIVVLAQRAVAGLSPKEVSRAITLSATIANDNDELLREKFGGCSIS
ncbi:MAG: YbjN domain-containing protein [cyanobacterium endosymbiont of Rhopalodia gibba]|jgi:hypothetical protein